MIKVPIQVEYRMPRPLEARRFPFDIYECEWILPISKDVEVKSLSANDIMDGIEAIQKTDNGCDSMRITYHGKRGHVEVKLSRDIDIGFHTSIFPDGRKVQFITTDMDGFANTAIDRFEEAVKAAGYHDLLTKGVIGRDV